MSCVTRCRFSYVRFIYLYSNANVLATLFLSNIFFYKIHLYVHSRYTLMHLILFTICLLACYNFVLAFHIGEGYELVVVGRTLILEKESEKKNANQ